MAYEQNTDEELVGLYLDGDEHAFTEIVQRHIKPLYNFVLRLSGNGRDAEEIVQESFVKVWKHMKNFRQGEKFKTWLYTISRNTTIDVLRKKKSILFSAFETDDGNNMLENTVPDNELLPDELFENTERKEFAEKLLENLPLHYREVLLLRYQGELDFSEIASALGKSVNTVKSQHRRALLALRKELVSAPK
jgi:RNA polymerase sigma-70 factor (ECF subfamily)